jgi:hypothetical protein
MSQLTKICSLEFEVPGCWSRSLSRIQNESRVFAVLVVTGVDVLVGSSTFTNNKTTFKFKWKASCSDNFFSEQFYRTRFFLHRGSSEKAIWVHGGYKNFSIVSYFRFEMLIQIIYGSIKTILGLYEYARLKGRRALF